MVSIKFIFNLKDKKALLAEDVLYELYKNSYNSHIFIDKIGPSRVTFNKFVKKYGVKTFPAIIVAGSGQLKEIKIEGDKYFEDKETLKKTISDMFLKV